jgi:hypothetical protein
MPALVAGIHVFPSGLSASKARMAETSQDEPGHDEAKRLRI